MNFRVIHLDMKNYEKIREIDEAMVDNGFRSHLNVGTGRTFRIGIGTYLVAEEALSDNDALQKAKSVLSALNVEGASVSIMPEHDYARDRSFFLHKSGKFVRDSCGIEFLKSLFLDMAPSEMEMKVAAVSFSKNKAPAKDKWGIIRIGFEKEANVLLDIELLSRSLICRGFGPYSLIQRIPTIPENCFLVRYNPSESGRSLQKLEDNLKRYLKKQTGKTHLRVWDEIRACPRIASELAERIESDVEFLDSHRLLHSAMEDSIRILSDNIQAETLAKLPDGLGPVLGRRIANFWECSCERPLTVVGLSLAPVPFAALPPEKISSVHHCDDVMRSAGYVPLLSSPGVIYLKEREKGSVINVQEIQDLSAKAGSNGDVSLWSDFRSFFDFYLNEVHGKGEKDVWRGPEDYANPVRDRLNLVHKNR